MNSIKKNQKPNNKGEIPPMPIIRWQILKQTLKEAHQCFLSEREDLFSLCLFWSVMYSRDIVDFLIAWAFSTADLYAGCLKAQYEGSLYVHVTGVLESPGAWISPWLDAGLEQLTEEVHFPSGLEGNTHESSLNINIYFRKKIIFLLLLLEHSERR